MPPLHPMEYSILPCILHMTFSQTLPYCNIAIISIAWQAAPLALWCPASLRQMGWGFGAPYPVAARCHAPWSARRGRWDVVCDGKVVPPEEMTAVSIARLVVRIETFFWFMTVYDVYCKYIELVHFGFKSLHKYGAALGTSTKIS